MATTIEWTQNADGTPGSTWNPIMGCSRISPGCGGGGSFSGTAGQRGGCYAEWIAARFSSVDKNGKMGPFNGFAKITENGPRWTGKVALLHEKLDEPLHVRKPTTLFISMSDVFHEELKNEEIAALFGVMAAAERHTFQILTKRSKRMREWFAWVDKRAEDGLSLFPDDPKSWRIGQMLAVTLRRVSGIDGRRVGTRATGWNDFDPRRQPWPLPNVWLGVSCESAAYKHRLDDLRACPAVVKFCSLEPLLEDLGTVDFTGIDQAIVGAESGRGARPMFEDWVRAIRDQATAQRTAFFYKQKLGANGRKVSLPMLDGRQWTDMPVRAT